MGDATTLYTNETFPASDGYPFWYRRYDPFAAGFGAPRGEIVCLHGIQSHSGWYDYSSSRLCAARFRVHFLDRRGSGMNSRERGDTPNFQQLIDDVTHFLQALRTDPALPLFLLAISWGGKLALGLLRQDVADLRGLVLVCPGIFPKVRPTLRERLAIGRSRLLAPQRRFRIPLSDPQLFTATPRWQQFIQQDPLSLREASARLLVESVRLDRYIRSAPTSVVIPTMLLLAGQDRIIDNQCTRAYVEQFRTHDKEILEYP